MTSVSNLATNAQQAPYVCVYTGYVRHRRFTPKPHYFNYRIRMLFLNLSTTADYLCHYPLTSDTKPALGWLRRKDYIGDAQEPLQHTIAKAVEAKLGVYPTGDIYLLTQLRYWGLVMNPISIFYCYDDQKNLVATVLQVTNTPWKEQILYVLDSRQTGKKQQHAFAKYMHVSPFNDVDMVYHCRMTLPSHRLSFHLENRQEDIKHTDATLSLKRQPLTKATLLYMVLLQPYHSAKVVLGIYYNALKLWLKGNPVYDHQAVEALQQRPIDKVPIDKVPIDKVPIDKVPIDKVPMGTVDRNAYHSIKRR